MTFEEWYYSGDDKDPNKTYPITREGMREACLNIARKAWFKSRANTIDEQSEAFSDFMRELK